MTTTYGYVYCFSNISMPDILKIGMTERTPEERLIEANTSNTWKPPSDYKIEIAKKICNPNHIEKTLHKVLSQYRVHERREFFRISLDKFEEFLELIQGETIYFNDIENENNKKYYKDDKENLYCQYCNNVFVNQKSLDAHQKKARYCLKKQQELKVIKEYNCEDCNTIYFSEFELKNHRDICVQYLKNRIDVLEEQNICNKNILKHIQNECIRKDIEINNKNNEIEKLTNNTILLNKQIILLLKK